MDLYFRLLLRERLLQLGFLPNWDPRLLGFLRVARIRIYLERRETVLWGKFYRWPDLMWSVGRFRLKVQHHFWERSWQDAPLGLEVFSDERPV